jgi:acyl carrier protein
MEQILANIWQEILGLEQVGIHDNFFELGGHSLLAIQVISRLEDAFHVKLPLRGLFETPTVSGLAVAVARQKVEQAEDGTMANILAELEELSAEEVEELLSGEHLEAEREK